MGKWRRWQKIGSGFKQRYSRDMAWIEVRCPAKHRITVTVFNTDRLESFMAVHGDH